MRRLRVTGNLVRLGAGHVLCAVGTRAGSRVLPCVRWEYGGKLISDWGEPQVVVKPRGLTKGGWPRGFKRPRGFKQGTWVQAAPWVQAGHVGSSGPVDSSRPYGFKGVPHRPGRIGSVRAGRQQAHNRDDALISVRVATERNAVRVAAASPDVRQRPEPAIKTVQVEMRIKMRVG